MDLEGLAPRFLRRVRLPLVVERHAEGVERRRELLLLVEVAKKLQRLLVLIDGSVQVAGHLVENG